MCIMFHEWASLVLINQLVRVDTSTILILVPLTPRQSMINWLPRHCQEHQPQIIQNYHQKYLPVQRTSNCQCAAWVSPRAASSAAVRSSWGNIKFMKYFTTHQAMFNSDSYQILSLRPDLTSVSNEINPNLIQHPTTSQYKIFQWSVKRFNICKDFQYWSEEVRWLRWLRCQSVHCLKVHVNYLSEPETNPVHWSWERYLFTKWCYSLLPCPPHSVIIIWLVRTHWHRQSRRLSINPHQIFH